MSYQPLARKYRPAQFAALVGQEAVATALANAIAMEREPHALIFTGVRGVGKTTIARLYAKALNCPARAANGAAEPCNVCESCLAIARGNHEDVLEIDGASNTGVADVRALQETVDYRPQRSRFKVYIIDEVHMLSQAAFNALLKTLEEPPGHVVFVFATTEMQKVPQTILSRCQAFYLKKLPVALIIERVNYILREEGIEFEDKAVALIAREGHGSMRDALTLLDQAIALGHGRVSVEGLGHLISNLSSAPYLQLLQAMTTRNAAQALAVVEQLDQAGAEFAQVVEETAQLARHGFVVQGLGVQALEVALLGLDDSEVSALVSLAQAAAPFDLNRIFRTLVACRHDLDGSALDRYVVENFLCEWCLDPGLPDLGALLSGASAPPVGVPTERPSPPLSLRGAAVGGAGPSGAAPGVGTAAGGRGAAQEATAAVEATSTGATAPVPVAQAAVEVAAAPPARAKPVSLSAALAAMRSGASGAGAQSLAPGALTPPSGGASRLAPPPQVAAAPAEGGVQTVAPGALTPPSGGASRLAVSPQVAAVPAEGGVQTVAPGALTPPSGGASRLTAPPQVAAAPAEGGVQTVAPGALTPPSGGASRLAVSPQVAAAPAEGGVHTVSPGAMTPPRGGASRKAEVPHVAAPPSGGGGQTAGPGPFTPAGATRLAVPAQAAAPSSGAGDQPAASEALTPPGGGASRLTVSPQIAAPPAEVPAAQTAKLGEFPATWRQLVDTWKQQKPLQARKLEEVHPVEYTPGRIVLAINPTSYASKSLLQRDEQARIKEHFRELFGFDGVLQIDATSAAAAVPVAPVLPETILTERGREADDRRERLIEEAKNAAFTKDLLSALGGQLEGVRIVGSDQP